MQKPIYCLCYDEPTQEWCKASLDDLIMRDEPELIVIPVYAMGERGEQCSWGELSKALGAARTEARKGAADYEREEMRKAVLAMKSAIKSIDSRLKELADDQAETNKLVRTFCNISIILWLLGAIGFIVNFFFFSK